MKMMRKNRLFGAVALGAGVFATAWTSTSHAQDPAVPPPAEGAPPPAAAMPALPPPAPMAPPPPVASTPAPAPTGNDLDITQRRIGIGYAGTSQVPLGLGAPDLTAPAVGLRYWASETMGVDVAVGFAWAGGSTETLGTSADKNSTYGFLLQGGVPLALANRRHVSFQVIPFATIAFGGTKTGVEPNVTSFNGLRVDAGARAGLELFFGFIGVPELSLNATVGAQFSMRRTTMEMGGVSSSDLSLGASTTVQNNPWDIFAGNVAARYYF
jgi:hypothetical protein